MHDEKTERMCLFGVRVPRATAHLDQTGGLSGEHEVVSCGQLDDAPDVNIQP